MANTPVKAESMANTLITAPTAVDEALQALAAAHGSFRESHEAVARQGYREGGAQGVAPLAAVASVERLNQHIVRRLRGLELQSLLDAARTTGSVDASWVEQFTRQLQNVAPHATQEES